ncbi:MAG: hypothetical protein RIS70_1336 [Planctomycetota bacterium]|jgi:preprotein translocase subunit YajC
MLDWLHSSLSLTLAQLGMFAQAEAEGGGGGGLGQFLSNPMFPIFAIMLVFMLVMLPSERKRKAEQAKLLEGLTKNDRIVTIGGMVGTIVNVRKGEEMLTLRVDENNDTRVTILRSAVARVLSDTDQGKKDKSDS